jgi:hypothetical protein
MVSGSPAWATPPSATWATDTNGLTYSQYVAINAASSTSYRLYVNGATNLGSLYIGGTEVINSSREITVASLKIGSNTIIDSDGKLRSTDGLSVDIAISWDHPNSPFYLNFKGGILNGCSTTRTGEGPITQISRTNT